MSLYFKQAYLSNNWPTVLEMDPESKCQDTNSIKMETIQKSTAIFKKIISQNHSNFVEDPKILEGLGFFEALGFLTPEKNAVINPYSADHTYIKKEPAFVEKFTCKENPNNNLRFLLSANKSVQTKINNNTDKIIHKKKHVKYTPALRQEAINMVCSGLSVSQVSQKLKVRYDTVKYWMENHKLQNLELLLSNPQNHFNCIDNEIIINNLNKVARKYTQHSKTRRQHLPELRQKAINMVCSGLGVPEVSKKLEIPSITLRKWMKKRKLQNLELLLSNSQNYSHCMEDLKVLEDRDLFKDLDSTPENNADITPYSTDSIDAKQMEKESLGDFLEKFIPSESQNDNLELLLSNSHCIEDLKVLEDRDIFKGLDSIQEDNADINPYNTDSIDAKQIEKEPLEDFIEKFIPLESQNDNVEFLLSIAESIHYS